MEYRLVSNFQRHTANKMHIPHPEEIYYKVLADMAMKAKKLHNAFCKLETKVCQGLSSEAIELEIRWYRF